MDNTEKLSPTEACGWTDSTGATCEQKVYREGTTSANYSVIMAEDGTTIAHDDRTHTGCVSCWNYNEWCETTRCHQYVRKTG